jgi:hypothetical protein
MVARGSSTLVGALSALPTVIFWAFIAYLGWTGHMPSSDARVDIPMGYRVVSHALILFSIPIAVGLSKEGVAFGRANAAHFDSRRMSLLGVRWYHFLWMPFLLHLMLVCAAFGAIYGFQWVVTAWQNGASLLSFIPILFVVAMLLTLQLLAIGAGRAYEALAGFDDDSGMSAGARVMKYGFGYTIATIAAQAAIAGLHFGLAALARKLFG